MAFTDSDIWRYANTESGAPDDDCTVQALPYPLVVLMLDELVHTVARPQCEDTSCPCHEEVNT